MNKCLFPKYSIGFNKKFKFGFFIGFNDGIRVYQHANHIRLSC